MLAALALVTILWQAPPSNVIALPNPLSLDALQAYGIDGQAADDLGNLCQVNFGRIEGAPDGFAPMVVCEPFAWWDTWNTTWKGGSATPN
jgi:hypothetical protein